ncbi:type IV pilin biogenesis protein [Acidithiobacillus caldus]
MKLREIRKKTHKALAVCLTVGINLLPLQGVIPLAHATGGLNIPTSEQPQVLIILDNSQGMAGVIKGPDGLSGAIMSGSGTVPEDSNSSSPVDYQASSDFTPPAQGGGGQTVPYSVPCNSGILSSLGSQACSAFGAGSSGNAYVDNSESMFNVSENAIRSIMSTPEYNNNIQFGLETYGLKGGVGLYNTWVYYMSGPNGFTFGSSSTPPSSGLQAVPNPCYGSVSNGYFTNNSCYYIYRFYNYSSAIYSDRYLYIQDSSDDPIINDVLYAYAYQWQPGATNAVAQGPTTYGTNLPDYEKNNGSTGVQYSRYSNGLASGMTPTSAGYFPDSYQLWESQRGFGFNASTLAAHGTIVVPISASNSANQSNIDQAILPEVLSQYIQYGSTPVTASAGHAPVAGAFRTAIKYFSGTSSQGIPPTTCGKKYVIFITFGQPTKGLHGNVYPPLGSASAKEFGVTSITSSMVSATTTSTNGIKTNNNAVVETVNNVQKLYSDGVKTYVIGVGSAVNPDIPGTSTAQRKEALQGHYVLQAIANAGGTNTVYSATSASALQSALNSVVANILGKSVVSSYAAPPTVTTGSLEFLLKNVNPVTGQGNLYAYPVTSTGAVSSTATWTANEIMTAATRSSNLYTTPLGGSNGSGAPQTFPIVASTNSAAFGTLPNNLSASDIANYTIDPSYDNGTYLGGRQSGWYVGLPASQVPAQVLVPPDSASLLSDSSYRSFAASHASRQNAVLFADNDGFLYALGYDNTGSPTLLWGWMPGGLLPSLQNYQSFWQGNNMGAFSTVDAYDDGGWHTYVVGVANNGGITYDLQLGGSAAPMLKHVVSQYILAGDSQTQPSAPVYYQVQTSGGTQPVGTTWALFALNSSSGNYLGVLSVGSGVEYLDKLPFDNTATPYIDTSGNLFLGDAKGNVYEMSNSELLNILTANKTTKISLSDFSSVGNYAQQFATGLHSNVQFIGGTSYGGANYLRVQGPNGITLFKQSNGAWAPVWTAYSGGAGSWSGGTYTAQSGSVTSNSITPLPSGSTVSDRALISGGNVIVPVTIPAPADSCGFSTAAYYIYGLSNGIFPSGAFVSTSGTSITQGYVIGRGSAYTPNVSIFNGRSLLQSAASQNTDGSTSGFASALGAGLPVGGPVAWRLIMTP